MQQQFIFLSPHLDDAALSCGGLIWDLAQQGHTVEVWTLFAGNPPDEDFSLFAEKMHQSWGHSGQDVLTARRLEDRAACNVLGAQPRHLDWPDVIYRSDCRTGKPVVNNNDELFGKPPEDWLVEEIAQWLINELPPGAELACPMGLGTHIDHLAVRKAVTTSNLSSLFYPDYPYVLENFNCQHTKINPLKPISYPLGEAALRAWQDAVLCYRSQLDQFWRDDEEARLCLRNYIAGGGDQLWSVEENQRHE